MRVLMLSLDRGLLGQQGSGDVVERHKKYADLAGSLDIIVLSRSQPIYRLQEPINGLTANLRVFSSGSTKWSHYRKTSRLAKKLDREQSYDLIVSQDFAAPIGVCLKYTLNKPWIVNVHGMFFEKEWLGMSPVKWYLYFKIRRALRCADGLRVNNVTIQDKLRSWGMDQPILVQPTPIDISKFSPYGGSPEGRQNSKVTVLYVGRLSPEKNIPMLIRAFKESRMENSELKIVGWGPEEGKLKSLAAGDPRIKFLGAKSTDELPEIYRETDIFVLPSNTESFGQVLLQAAASGCAIIATATTGARSILGDSESGLLIPVGSQKALEETLTKLISTTFEREYWQKQALVLAEKYDGEKGIIKTVEFWKQMAGLRPDTPAQAGVHRTGFPPSRE